MKENWIQYFKPPFYYDAASGFIFDQEGKTPAEVRGWGMLQYKPNGDKVQDEMGHDIAKGLNMVLNLEVSDTTEADSSNEAGN